MDAGSAVAQRAELSAILRFAGNLEAGGAQETWQVRTSATVARRADRQLMLLYGARCGLRVVASSRAARRGLRVDLTVPPRFIRPLGLVEADGGPAPSVPRRLLTSGVARWAYIRGTMLAGLSLSGPGRPHCEIGAPTQTLAADLAALLRQEQIPGRGFPHGQNRWRVVVKSGVAIAALLAGTGATAAYLRWDDARLRRAVRNAATRGSNADRANAARSVGAASSQLSEVRAVLEAVDPGALDDDLRAVALARLANPSASLRELAELLGVSKPTVHRRLTRLRALHRTVGPA